MIEVIVRQDEPLETMLRRFYKKVLKSGILREVFDRRHFVGKAEKRNILNRSRRRKK